MTAYTHGDEDDSLLDEDGDAAGHAEEQQSYLPGLCCANSGLGLSYDSAGRMLQHDAAGNSGASIRTPLRVATDEMKHDMPISGDQTFADDASANNSAEDDDGEEDSFVL